MLIGIVDLLERHGFDPNTPAKIVRHQHSGRYDVHEMRRDGWIEYYQGFQARPVFDGCQQIVSFLGTEGTRASFLGVYNVVGRRSARTVKLPPAFPFPQWQTDGKYFYDLELAPGYQALQDRVVIEWGAGARSWVQKLRNKEVVELIADGRVRDPFSDYHEFVLTFDELKAIVRNPEANREWQARLSAVAGIYLIQATTTGEQYIGSAYGVEGIWGRWQAYAANGHGGNRLLKNLVRHNRDYPRAFRFTLLHVLPASTTHQEVLRWEGIYKQKLGTRAAGLNLN